MSPALSSPPRSRVEAAREIGEAARCRRLPVTANPFGNPALAAAWARGWIAADDRIETAKEKRDAG